MRYIRIRARTGNSVKDFEENSGGELSNRFRIAVRDRAKTLCSLGLTPACHVNIFRKHSENLIPQVARVKLCPLLLVLIGLGSIFAACVGPEPTPTVLPIPEPARIPVFTATPLPVSIPTSVPLPTANPASTPSPTAAATPARPTPTLTPPPKATPTPQPTVTSAGASQPTPTPPPLPTTSEEIGTISGHVYQADGRTPMADIQVFAKDFKSNQWKSGATTSQDGGYILPLHSGRYRVTACPSCSGTGLTRYADQIYEGASVKRDSTSVPVSAPGDTPGIDFTLEPAGTISGHVYQADGRTPIAGMLIFAVHESGQWMDTTARTDQDGSYALTLPAGTYPVGTCPKCSDMEEYARVWHGGVIGRNDSTFVAVRRPMILRA